jgi:membrane-bound serine protease (ClpP class)
MLKVLLILAAAFILFELVEHVIIPLVWLISKKNRRSPSGETGMIGQIAEVKKWEGKKGRVFVRGELWNAESDESFEPGDEAVVHAVKRLVLILKRPGD